jgi:translation initiation factor IF-1
MLQDVFIEQTVKRREIATLKPLYYISLVMTIINFLIGIALLFPLFFVSGGMFLFMTVWINSLLNLEFDYNYTNGELDIARIRGGAKRKELVSISQGDIVVMAPSHTEPVKQYLGRKMPTFDCTSHDVGMSYYVMIFKKDGREKKLLFQPNEEILDILKRMNAHSVYRDGEA